MPRKLPAHQTLFWLLLLVICLTSRKTTAQVYANSQKDSVSGVCLCSVSNPDNPVNSNSLDDYSSFNIGLSLLNVYVSQTLIFPSVSSAGCDSLVVGIGSGDVLLSANLLGGVSVETYNGNTPNNDATVVTSSILQLLQTNNRGSIVLKPAQAFDRVKITLKSSLLGLLTTLRLYYAYRKPAQAAPYVLPVSPAICSGGAITLSVNPPPAAIVRWYNAATGGTLLNTGPALTVNPAVTTTYYAEYTVNNCVSLRTPVTVTIHPKPDKPVYTVPQEIVCGALPVTIFNYQPGINYSVRLKYTFLFNRPAFDTAYVVSNSNTFNTPDIPDPNPASVDVSIRSISAATGCISDSVAMKYIAGGSTRYPSTDADSLDICIGDTAVLHAFNPFSAVSTLLWYDAPTGGNLLHTGRFFSVAPITTTTYYAANKLQCEYPVRHPVKVKVSKLPAPVYTVPQGYLCGIMSTVVQNHQVGFNYNVRIVYRNVDNSLILDTSYIVHNTSIVNSPDFIAPYSARADIYLQAVNPLTGCRSDSVHKIYNLGASTGGPAVTVDSLSVCQGDSVTLYGYDPSYAFSTVRWYDAPSNGTLLFTGPYYKVSPVNTTTYYVATAIHCEYPVRKAVRVTVRKCTADVITHPGANTVPVYSLLCYPNPASGEVNFKGGRDFTGSLISVTAINGRLVYQGVLTANRWSITASLPDGIYFIKITTKDRSVYVARLVIRK